MSVLAGSGSVGSVSSDSLVPLGLRGGVVGTVLVVRVDGRNLQIVGRDGAVRGGLDGDGGSRGFIGSRLGNRSRSLSVCLGLGAGGDGDDYNFRLLGGGCRGRRRRGLDSRLGLTFLRSDGDDDNIRLDGSLLLNRGGLGRGEGLLDGGSLGGGLCGSGGRRGSRGGRRRSRGRVTSGDSNGIPHLDDIHLGDDVPLVNRRGHGDERGSASDED